MNANRPTMIVHLTKPKFHAWWGWKGYPSVLGIACLACSSGHLLLHLLSHHSGSLSPLVLQEATRDQWMEETFQHERTCDGATILQRHKPYEVTSKESAKGRSPPNFMGFYIEDGRVNIFWKLPHE